MTWFRALAVLSAAFLVGAFALALMLPPMLPLGSVVSWFGRGALFGLHDAVRGVAGEWAWWRLAMPLLVRPAWLLPASLGILCAGMAATLAGRGKATRNQRRRS